jgi:hypothetical protein
VGVDRNKPIGSLRADSCPRTLLRSAASPVPHAPALYRRGVIDHAAVEAGSALVHG